MTTQPAENVLMLGPREAEVLRLLWLYGPSTVRELLGRIVADPPLAYTTVMGVCVGLVEKGLLTRQRAVQRKRTSTATPYVYAAAIGETTLSSVARSVEGRQVMRLPAPPTESHDAPHPDAAERHPLTQRAEAAERRAETLAIKLTRAEQRIEAIERRAHLAEERAGVAERRVEQLEKQLGRSPRRTRPVSTWYTNIVEHRDPAGVCRVCGASGPLLPHPRSDDLRVCLAESCRAEAKRRDNTAKQRRYNARVRGGREKM
jgi:predicted transcriptional regulator